MIKRYPPNNYPGVDDVCESAEAERLEESLEGIVSCIENPRTSYPEMIDYIYTLATESMGDDKTKSSKHCRDCIIRRNCDVFKYCKSPDVCEKWIVRKAR